MKRFNLRVYALIINENNEVLLADECRNGYSFTKFPGGGLEWGEGIKDTIERELKEELDIEAIATELYFVNDYFQQSAFREADQLISFYYLVDVDLSQIITREHDVPLTSNGEEFRWVKISDLESDDVTFPVDRIVLQKLKGEF